MRVRAALLLAPLLAAGCLGAVSEPPGAGLPTTPAPSTLVLQPDGNMRAEAGAEERVPLRWGWRQWLDGVQAPAWTSEPAEHAMLVTAANATIVYEALAPVTTMAQRPEFTVWFGVEAMVTDHGFEAGPPVMAPGQRAVVPFELGLPAGGLYVGPGERLVLRIGSYYEDDEARGAIATVLGGTGDLTRLDLQTLPLPPPTTPRVSETSEATVDLMGGRCVGLDPATENDLAWLDVRADPARGRLIGIDVDVAHVEGRGPPDIDILLLDAEGERVAYSGGSAGVEEIRLREPNLLGVAPDASWRLGVYACTPQQASAAVTVALHYV